MNKETNRGLKILLWDLLDINSILITLRHSVICAQCRCRLCWNDNSSLNINTHQLETTKGNIMIVSWDWRAANFTCLRSAAVNLTVFLMKCYSSGNFNLLSMYKVTPLMQNFLLNFYCFLLYFILILIPIFYCTLPPIVYLTYIYLFHSYSFLLENDVL